MRPRRESLTVGPEGVQMPEALSEEISLEVCSLFASPLGQKVMTYLRSFTTNFAHQPGTTIEALAHREGARWLLGVIQARVEHGRQLSEEGANLRGADNAH